MSKSRRRRAVPERVSANHQVFAFWWEPSHLCEGGALQRSAKMTPTFSRALALGFRLPVAKATIFSRYFFR